MKKVSVYKRGLDKMADNLYTISRHEFLGDFMHLNQISASFGTEP